MVPATRRRLLQVAAAATAGLAGCGRLTGGSAGSSRSVSDEEVSEFGDESLTDPPVLLVRAGTALPPVGLADEDGTTDTPPLEDRSDRVENTVVGSPERADRLAVADAADGDAVASFVSATDFGSESLYLESFRVEECYRLELCRIGWTAEEIQTDYGRRLRPYDERCEADAEVFESRLIRLPAPLDHESVASYGASVRGGGGCGGSGPGGAEGSSGGGTAGEVADPGTRPAARSEPAAGGDR